MGSIPYFNESKTVFYFRITIPNPFEFLHSVRGRDSEVQDNWIQFQKDLEKEIIGSTKNILCVMEVGEVRTLSIWRPVDFDLKNWIKREGI